MQSIVNNVFHCYTLQLEDLADIKYALTFIIVKVFIAYM